ncbi:MAG TPA: nitroreductase [Caulobacteraceae bacterium]|nr:nitroreductase [Caulobacteraceae bacterium]
MTVTEAVRRRISVRAFRPDPVPGVLVRELLELAARSPSGGNLQPWRVHVLTGAPLAALVEKALQSWAQGGEAPEYAVYPPDLWEPFRSRRFQAGEDLYATIDILREDRAGRLRQFANNLRLFGAPVGLFFSLERRLGAAQWSDLGMFMQTLMLLAVERGLGTCAQEFWSRLPRTVAAFLDLPDDHILFSGMALGYADEAAPINALRTRREPVDAFAEFRGF